MLHKYKCEGWNFFNLCVEKFTGFSPQSFSLVELGSELRNHRNLMEYWRGWKHPKFKFRLLSTILVI